MNDDTYRLRRKVIDCIYEVKKLYPNLPRIIVRITDTTKKNILASAKMNKCIIWVDSKTVDSRLRQVVFHEILHTVFGINHDENCPLMKPVYTPISKKEQNKIFLQYIRG